MDQPLPILTLQGVSETHLLPRPKYYPALFIASLLLLLPFFQSGMRLCLGWWSSREILQCLELVNDVFVGDNNAILAGGILHRKQ